MSRPEHIAPPEIFYGDDEARKYTANSRVQHIQSVMATRALELLNLPPWFADGGALLLDVGSGSGLSGDLLTENGHEWIGLDISPSMLEVAIERECEGDSILADVGQGIGFRAGSFDGAISISVLQWLLNADTTSVSPIARLSHFFATLHAALRNGSRAVLQFYPESDEQVRLCMTAATKAGFGGGLVVDYPNSKKAKKFFLVLWVGGEMLPPPGWAGERIGDKQNLPQGLVSEHENPDDVGPGSVRYEKSRGGRDQKLVGGKRRKGKGKGKEAGGKEWILKKKELYRKRGKEDVPTDSKYTGRKRKDRF